MLRHLRLRHTVSKIPGLPRTASRIPGLRPRHSSLPIGTFAPIRRRTTPTSTIVLEAGNRKRRARLLHQVRHPQTESGNAMLRVIRLTCVHAVMLAAIPVYAQVYKWVDERGVTNYASQPPADRNARANAATVADRISVYAPEPAVQRAINAIALGKDRILSDRIDSLERQRAAESQSSQYAAAAEARAAEAAYAQCLAERRVDCDSDSGYYPYGSGGVLTVVRRRPLSHIPSMARSHVAAGNFARVHSEGSLRRAGVFRP